MSHVTIVEAAGGQALPFVVDIRNEDQVQACIEEAVKVFGGIDIVVNYASAIRFNSINSITFVNEVNICFILFPTFTIT